MKQNIEDLLRRSIPEIKKDLPQLTEFFDVHGIVHQYATVTLGEYLASMSEDQFQDLGVNREQIVSNLADYLDRISTLSDSTQEQRIQSITLLGGHDKSGNAESIELQLDRGTITSIVGPTGSGKSRLLADIEWMAQGDTPTRRHILVNGRKPATSERFSLENKLVAQLSQNMNFVMDATVSEFIQMHADSRFSKNRHVVEEIISQANMLAGETFTADTPVTSLSGGQSRALMIADTALLSTSPIVLVDEIENAGIDRHRALRLLVDQNKIVLIATHDPILALMADRRLVIRHGGIHSVIMTSPKEKQNLSELEALDAKLTGMRQKLRQGELIESI